MKILLALSFDTSYSKGQVTKKRKKNTVAGDALKSECKCLSDKNYSRIVECLFNFACNAQPCIYSCTQKHLPSLATFCICEDGV